MPKEILNEVEEMDDDISETPDVKADPSTADENGDVTAESSAASDVTDDDALSVVRDVVDEKEEKASEASSAETKDGQQPGEQETTDEREDDYSDVPFAAHPRFQELLAKNREAREQLAKREGEVSELKTDAQRYRNVETFIDEQGLNGQEAQQALEIGGLMKTNPVEAWKRLQPTIRNLAIAAGELLPDDLKTKVQAGEMSREAALETSRARAAAQTATARADFDRQQATTRQQSDLQQQIDDTVSSWESERRTRDPNFDAKLPALEKEVAWLQAKEGKPKMPGGVRVQLQKAYDNVSKTFAPPTTQQKKPAVRPVTGGQVNGNVRAEPKSTLDIVRAKVAEANSAAA